MHKRKPTHPGRVFLEDVLKPLGIAIGVGAKGLGLSRKTLSGIVNERFNITPDIALRIGKATNTSPESWLVMQAKVNLWKASQESPNVELKSFLTPKKGAI